MTAEVNSSWLDDLKQLEAKATKGPWISLLDVFEDAHGELGRTCGKPFQRHDDARFIAAVRSVAPRLIRIAEAAAEKVESCPCKDGIMTVNFEDGPHDMPCASCSKLRTALHGEPGGKA